MESYTFSGNFFFLLCVLFELMFIASLVPGSIYMFMNICFSLERILHMVKVFRLAHWVSGHNFGVKTSMWTCALHLGCLCGLCSFELLAI